MYAENLDSLVNHIHIRFNKIAQLLLSFSAIHIGIINEAVRNQ